VLKLSADKQSLPGCKQVFRVVGGDGHFEHDVIARLEEPPPSEDAVALLGEVMRGGQRIDPSPALGDLRQHFVSGFSKLPERHKALEAPPVYPVEISLLLRDLSAETTEGVRVRELGE
jgi:nicotinate phosphoribosyltransferase